MMFAAFRVLSLTNRSATVTRSKSLSAVVIISPTLPAGARMTTFPSTPNGVFIP